MTENETSDSSLPEQAQRAIRPDWLLCLAVSWADLGLYAPVTLNVKGAVVTGNVITLKRYLEGVMNQFDEPGNEFAIIISRAFDDVKNRMFPSDTNQVDEADRIQMDEPYEYIHLENARMLSGNTFLPNQKGFYWRGRLDQIDAFSFGSLGPTQNR